MASLLAVDPDAIVLANITSFMWTAPFALKSLHIFRIVMLKSQIDVNAALLDFIFVKISRIG